MSGTKVTSDPEGLNKPVQEGTGFVASDSLAAESLQSSGSFASGDPNASADPQRAHGSTASNTDTSAASTLDAAASHAERGSDSAQPYVPARTVGADSYGEGGAAPSYVSADQSSNSAEFGGGPKGRGLQEGGFDDSAPNASFTSEIGSKNDPGRVAERRFEAGNSASAGDAAPRQTKVDDSNEYSVLRDEQA